VRLSEAQKDQAVLTYQQTIQRVFQEVSDALIAYDRDQEFHLEGALTSQGESWEDAWAEFAPESLKSFPLAPGCLVHGN
jgi:outer membrane protein TolC